MTAAPVWEGRRPGPVVVGYDGSDCARQALVWAAAEARRRRRPLRLVVAVDWTPLVTPGTPGTLVAPPDLRALGQRIADDGLAHLRAAPEGLAVDVRTAVHDWTPVVSALLGESATAGLLVVGSRGRGSFSELLVGSTSAQVAAHAHCPVVVVHDTAADARGVVVGVDASEQSGRAVAFALAAAADRGVELTAVHAWQVPSLWGQGEELLPPEELARLEQEEALLAGEVLAGAASSEPDVVVRRRVVRGHPAKALVQAARGAELLVVGSRGRGGFRGLLLGSVSRAALHHARCPVAVVHDDR